GRGLGPLLRGRHRAGVWSNFLREACVEKQQVVRSPALLCQDRGDDDGRNGVDADPECAHPAPNYQGESSKDGVSSLSVSTTDYNRRQSQTGATGATGNE